MLISPDVSKKIKESANIFLAPNVNIKGVGVLAAPSLLYGATSSTNINLGGYSYLSPRCEVSHVSIGNYTSIASGCTIALEHPTDRLTASPVTYLENWLEGNNYPTAIERTPHKETYIGNDVWIGANVIIKAGVSIGDGCFIGAGSVVAKDISAFSVAAGNPCRVIRNRFDMKLAEEVKMIRWFDFDWQGVNIDWRSPSSSLGDIQKNIENGLGRRFRRFKYEAFGGFKLTAV